MDDRIDRLRRRLGAAMAREPRVGLFVDGPNVLREEFDVDLDDVRRAGRSQGTLSFVRLYLDEHATPGLIQAAEARGFEVVVTSGDVDVKLAIDAAEAITAGTVEVLAIASRDTDFKPLLELAGRRGLDTVAITPGRFGRSDAIVNAAQTAIHLDEHPSGTGSDGDSNGPVPTDPASTRE